MILIILTSFFNPRTSANYLFPHICKCGNCSRNFPERHFLSERNVFDIPRSQLIDVVLKLRRHFLQNDYGKASDIQDDDARHSVPVKEMSNYDEYPRTHGQAPPLRDIDAQPVRQHVFGNPFKVNKVSD